jgi:serine/threonine-protein kinase
MSDDPRVEELLEKLLDTGGSPEDVCCACPELLPLVRARWQRLRTLEAEVGALFPVSTTVDAAGPATPPTPELPCVRGYEVQGVLGRGGMGVVYQARHLRLNRPVALKMLLAGAYAQPEELERFQREAEAVAGLRHPNIVQVHNVGDVDGRPYFTMEFVEGGSLAQKIAGTPQPARQAAALVATVAEAVHVAHQSGIVHRDLKPGNILLTPDGTPKLTDFGLAGRLEGGGRLTLSGAPMGTPSYMAPEQARAQKDAIGPATDVYALGVILYELLTGRPPFRSETAAATLQQVLAEDPVPPARLNRHVPRDLETICLKCLHKEAPRRYATAAALAEDLRRFDRGEPIAARPPGRWERFAWWVRRRPAAATVLAVSLVLALALVGGLVWQGRQRAALVRAVEADLREADPLLERSEWDKARAVLDRAEVRLGGGGPDRHRRRVAHFAAALNLAMRLDQVRLKRAPLDGGHYGRPQADRDYQAAFRDAGLGEFPDNPEGVAARVKASPVHRALVGALDDWAVCAGDDQRRAWLLAVARQADPDSGDWGNRARDPRTWRDRSALAALARTAPVAGQSVHLLLAVGERLQEHGAEATGFLKRVQREHPGDFWANFRLGLALAKRGPREAIGYYRGALAVRPGVVILYLNLGAALDAVGERDEAIDFYQRALRIDPRFAPAHNNLGTTLVAANRLDEALDHYRQALRLDPRSAAAHINLGNVLKTKHRFKEAEAHYRLALRLDPRFAAAHNNLGNVLQTRHRLTEALAHYRQALRLDPRFPKAHYNLGKILQTRGRLTEAIHHLQKAVALEPGNDSAHLRLALALQTQGRRLDRAIHHYEQALRINPKLPKARHNLGAALAALGRPDEAINHFRKAVELDPKFAKAQLALGGALLEQGRCREAEPPLRRCLALLPQTHPHRAAAQVLWQRCKQWLPLERRLPAVLQGQEKPASDVESILFAELCFYKKEYGASARLYAAAFTGTPRLPADPRTNLRYTAACAAARAGCGGPGGAGLSAKERARWRNQARAWLRADLDAWTRILENGPEGARAQARQMLARWRKEPHLAGLRDAEALDKLPPVERRECRTLWRDLDVLLRRAWPAK